MKKQAGMKITQILPLEKHPQRGEEKGNVLEWILNQNEPSGITTPAPKENKD